MPLRFSTNSETEKGMDPGYPPSLFGRKKRKEVSGPREALLHPFHCWEGYPVAIQSFTRFTVGKAELLRTTNITLLTLLTLLARNTDSTGLNLTFLSPGPPSDQQ